MQPTIRSGKANPPVAFKPRIRCERKPTAIRIGHAGCARPPPISGRRPNPSRRPTKPKPMAREEATGQRSTEKCDLTN